MQIATIRSGQVESTHDVSVVIVDSDSRVIGTWGQPGLTFFYRSAIKPFQTTISREAGVDLVPEQLAITCSSHGGYPLHLGLVEANLTGAGLTVADLRCPPAWPRDQGAKDLQLIRGERRPTRLFNNCSGKHSGWLAASVSAGWPTKTYLEPSHPIQQRVAALVHEVTGVAPEPVGVDGCGAPTPRGELTGLARSFSKLSSEKRFVDVALAMKRFPALVSSNTLNEGKFAAWWGGPVKGGAQGLIAAGRNGIGVAAKSHEGNVDIAIVGLLEAIRRVGLLSQAAEEALVDVARIPVLGGSKQVGTIEPTKA
ncbi:MAG: asparaginase [bacterium]|nr:asparaginase [bacterium]